MKTIMQTSQHFAFDPSIPPALRVHSGETVRFQCQDCYCGQLEQDGWDFARMDMGRNNPATGPLYIEEAQPGDVLRVKILTIDIAEEGLDRVTQLLAGLRGGAYKAMGSALARAANSGKTVAKREASKKYTISQGEFVAQTKNINHLSIVGAPCRSSLATGVTSSPLSSSTPSLERMGGCIPASCAPVPRRY